MTPTNALDALRPQRELPADWAFASSNWDFIPSTAVIFATSRWLLALLAVVLPTRFAAAAAGRRGGGASE